MARPPHGMAWIATPHETGAVAIVQVVGDAADILPRVTGIPDWPIGALKLATISDVEGVLCVRLDKRFALMMPHGGQRALQRVTAALQRGGLSVSDPEDVDPLELFPEARSRVEALMLAALSRAVSPLAIDLLLRQVDRLAGAISFTDDDRARSRRLNRLIEPPLVVLAGAPNVGKSTLSNLLAGRSVSIMADLPGTTRDYTAARIDFAGLVVKWIDTPGLRDAPDLIEGRAIEIANRLIRSADLLLAMADVESGWPRLPREPDLRIGSKSDVRARSDADICISAVGGRGIGELARLVRERLVPQRDLDHPGPWLFDPRLEEVGPWEHGP